MRRGGRLVNVKCGVLRGVLALLLALNAMACSEPTRTLVPLVTSTEWSVTEDLRIGSLDDSSSALTGVGSLVVDGAGRIYVSQSMDRVIRVFDSDGEALGTHGGSGDGPGEFRQIQRIGIFADTLYASDPTAQRITLLSLDGRLLETMSLTPRGLGSDWAALAPWWLDGEGTALALPGFLPPLRDPSAAGRVMLVRINRSGEVLDTVALTERAPEQSIHLRGPYGPMITNQPFGSPVLPVVSANGSLIAVLGAEPPAAGQVGTFDVAVLRSLNDTVWSHRYTYDGLDLTASVVDRVVAAKVGRLSRDAFPDRADAERQIRSGMSLPDHVPPISGGLFADDGSLWLRREELGGEDQRWTVVDRSGVPVAEVALPSTFSPEVVHPDHMWGVEIDELGVPYIVRYAIDR
jgi:hypothetical protein